MANISLHIVSTPRHVLSAIAIASKDAKENHQIIVCDQVLNNHVYLNTLNEYFKKSRLFSSSAIIFKSNKNGINKLQHRKNIFHQLDSYLSQCSPKKIYVGNDRRIEFQYIASRLKRSVEHIYVDEGTGTYNNGFGANKKNELFDQFLDSPLKKIAYGRWYDRPSMLGGSKWIDGSIICFPELANAAIKKKAIIPFQPVWFEHKNVKEFLYFYAKRISLDVLQIIDIQNIFILPHSMFLKSPAFDMAAFKCKIQEAISLGHIVGVKYHPRQHGDPLGLSEIDVIEIPRELPLELFLPLMTIKEAWGDVSSAVMSVKWLCPDANVYAEMCGDSKELNFFEGLFAEIGVQIIDLENSGGLIDAGK